jgi:ABC-type Fe3+/spermidine/putrescine transport system ATPase subunit
MPTASRGHGLELIGLNKSFGNVAVLRDVSVTAAPGSFVSLLGPSGCGKTTTLNILAGFETPDSGDVRLDGQSVARLPPHRRGLGMVFQSHALFPHMTIAGNIGFGPLMQGVAKAEIDRRVKAALELVRLGHVAEKYPRQLSGGQQQRIGIARALAAEPRIVLMDEPLSSLDAQLRRDMQTELRRIQRSVGTTVVYVTHDQEEALALSDQMVLMRGGVVEQAGTPEDLYQRPATEFVAGFIGEANLLDATRLDRADGFALAGGARISAAKTQTLAKLTSARLAVRPDRIALLATPQEGAFPVMVLDRNYAGDTFRYSLALPDGTPLVARLPLDASHLPLPGEAAHAMVRPGDWFVFQAAAA